MNSGGFLAICQRKAMRWGLRRASLLVKFCGFLVGICAAQLVLVTVFERRPSDCSHGVGSSSSSSSNTSLKTRVEIRDVTQRRVRIYCLILTHPMHYEKQAVPVNNTWARRCDKYYFVGSEKTNISIPLLYLPLRESRSILWKKVRMSFEAIHAQENLADYDFFLKADDDTYVVMENLRYLLRDQDPNEATVFGRRFAYLGDKRQQYMSGGAGYVLSRQALRLLVTVGFGSSRKNDYCNHEDITVEDYLMGRCLSQIGVKFVDSLDHLGRERFHPFRPENMVNPNNSPNWLKEYNYHPFEKCATCISDTSISFHYVVSVMEIEFLLYHMRAAAN